MPRVRVRTSLGQAIRSASLRATSGAIVDGTTAERCGSGARGVLCQLDRTGRNARTTRESGCRRSRPGHRSRLGWASVSGTSRAPYLQGRRGPFPGTIDRGVGISGLLLARALRRRTSSHSDTPRPDRSVLAPDPLGWIRTDAAIHCTASDAGVGDSPPNPPSAPSRSRPMSRRGRRPQMPPAPGVVGLRIGRATVRQAGPFADLRVDRAVPTVTCAPVSGRGWHVDVSVDCQASDPPGGSGLAIAGDRSFTLTARALPLGHISLHAPFAAHRPVCDVAGNCTVVKPPAPVAIDHAPPRVSCGRAPAGWVQAATVRCTAADAQSGLASPRDAAVALATTITAGNVAGRAFTNSHAVCDAVGNCATAGPIGPIKVDRQPPVVSCQSLNGAGSSGLVARYTLPRGGARPRDARPGASVRSRSSPGSPLTARVRPRPDPGGCATGRGTVSRRDH